ncbi:hypothetical protein JHK85_001099 [Glycine max]|nr:hypothetical protein JHK85_001099 [Glycine max]
MVIIHYSAASCCCVPSLHRSSPSRSILAPAIFFFRDAAPNLRLVSVWSQPPGSEGFGEPNKHSSRDASVGFSASSSSVIDFLTLCHRLKTTKRKGWVNHGIKGAESIADHMYRMALMALVSGDVPGLDRESFAPPNFGAPQFFGNMQQPHFANGTTPTPGCHTYLVHIFRTQRLLLVIHLGFALHSFFLLYRCIKIALVHDIAEAIVGDITPSDGVPKAEKSRMEQEALSKMCELLGGGIRAEEIKELWAEYENNSSLEANLVKDFDKGSFKLKSEKVGRLRSFQEENLYQQKGHVDIVPDKSCHLGLSDHGWSD